MVSTFLHAYHQTNASSGKISRVHEKHSHSSTYTCEEFLQDISIENIPIEEEEFIHPTGRAMWISGLIHSNIVIYEPFMVATIEFYFSKLAGMTESRILDDKFIVLNNLRGTPGTTKHDTHFYGATREFLWCLDQQNILLP